MMPRPDEPTVGAAGSLHDVRGLRVGHHTDHRRPTGCTVVLCEQGAVCGVDVRGLGTPESGVRPVETPDVGLRLTVERS